MFRRIVEYLRPFFRPREWFKFFGRLLQISLEGILTLTFMIILLIVVLLFFYRASQDATVSFYTYFFLTIFAVVVLIPIIGLFTYVTLRLLLQEPHEVFDDIRRDWQAGLTELERKGMDLRRIPLYLVLGGESNDQVQRLFRAANMEFVITQHPPGRSSLYWYANQDAVFITCNEAGTLSDLGRTAAERLLESRVIVSAQGPEPNVDLAATCWPTDESSAEESPPSGPEPAMHADALGGTMQVNQAMSEPGESTQEKNLQLGHERVDRDTARLEYLCRLISQERKPLAPINGMLTLLPINVILGDSSEGSVIKDAVRGDVTTAVKMFGLRFPVVALVNGWEDDPGFQELIRRLPPRHLTANRFGKGAQVGHDPTPDYLEAICHHVCKAFEDWIYFLFKQADALKKTGNRSLYDLLCKVRRYLRSRLMRILTEGYDCGRKNEHLNEVGIFLGCYAAASGRDAARRAFVPPVFSKLQEKSKDLHWTPESLRQDRRNRRMAYVAFAASLGLAIAAILVLFFRPGFS